MTNINKPKFGYILQHDNGAYFSRWTGIGPLFTPSKYDAAMFESKEEALYQRSLHFGLLNTKIKVITK